MKGQSEVVIQADLGGLSIAFTGKADDDEATLNARLDLYAKVVGRQRAKITLTEKLVDLLSVRKALESLPAREKEVLTSRVAERARQMAAMEAAHQAGNRRGEFTLSQSQRQQISQYDAESMAERDRFAKEREGLALQIPMIEAQISRLRAVIAGRDPVEPLETELGAKEGAAEAA